ncbi:MAG: phage portal protein [Sulfitobacter sp.]
MTLRSRIMAPFRKKDVGLSNSKEDRLFWNGLGHFGHREFSQVSAALRAGFVLANGMGMMPISLQQADGVEVFEGREYDLLNVKPNDFQTVVEFRETLTLHAVYTGTGRAFIRRGVDGRPLELVPLHPTWTPSGWIMRDGAYVLPVSIPDEGYLGDFERKDILEISNPRWDMIAGVNSTRSCQNVLGLATQLETRQARLADSNAPYGIISAKDGTSDGAIKKLKESWVKQFGKTGIAVIDFEAKFDQLMQNSSDQQILETRQFQIEEVARVYGVHPYLLMKTGGSGAQGAVSDVMLFHQIHGIGPWVGRYEASLACSLLLDTGLKAEMDENQLMRTTPQIRGEIYAKALGAGGNKPWMTENEVRAGKSPFRLPMHPDGNSLAYRKEAQTNDT